MEMNPHSSLSSLHHLGDLGDRKPLMISQEKGGALISRQRFQSHAELTLNLSRRCFLIWRRRSVGHNPLLGKLLVLSIKLFPRESSSAAMVIEAEVDENAIEPSVKSRLPVETLDLREGAKEGLLRHIFRLLAIVREIQRDLIGPLHIAEHKHIKRLALPPLARRHEVLILKIWRGPFSMKHQVTMELVR